MKQHNIQRVHESNINKEWKINSEWERRNKIKTVIMGLQNSIHKWMNDWTNK